MNSEINNILSQLNNNPDNEEEDSSILTLSKLIKNIHKSLINSQHSVRNIELDELKTKLSLLNDNEYNTIKFKIDDTEYNLNELTTQNSLNISTASAKIKVNINKIMEISENEEIIISKYNEAEDGISTELEVNFNNDINLLTET